MKKEISFKSFLMDISNWLTHTKESDIQAHHGTATGNRCSSGFAPSSTPPQSTDKVDAKYDRYSPLYLQDRDVNSHF